MKRIADPRQLEFTFGAAAVGPGLAIGDPQPESGAAESKPESSPKLPATGPDQELTERCRGWLRSLGMGRLARRVSVHWNGRLRTTAGQAECRGWRIDLNPRLVEFAPDEPEHTLKHELAHLMAQNRAGRRRIASHGAEWRQACADLGIPGEKACHSLPFARHRQQPRWAYLCPACGDIIERVRRIRYHAACAACCLKHNRGRFSKRFRLMERAIEPQPST